MVNVGVARVVAMHNRNSTAEAVGGKRETVETVAGVSVNHKRKIALGLHNVVYRNQFVNIREYRIHREKETEGLRIDPRGWLSLTPPAWPVYLADIKISL